MEHPMLTAFLMPFRAVPTLMHPGLRRFVLVPVVINILLFALAIWAASHYFEAFLNFMLPADSWLEYLRWLLWPLFALAWLIAVFYGFTITANLIGAPFNGVLAARAELLLTGKLPPEQPPEGLAVVIPVIKSELGKLWYLVSRAIPVLILFLIPGVNVLALPLWLALGCWFLALEYGDYPLANHGIEGSAQRQALKAKRLDSLAFGAGVMVMTLVPGLNFLAMPAGVVGATRLWQEKLTPGR
jgi:CysZ protein